MTIMKFNRSTITVGQGLTDPITDPIAITFIWFYMLQIVEYWAAFQIRKETQEW